MAKSNIAPLDTELDPVEQHTDNSDDAVLKRHGLHDLPEVFAERRNGQLAQTKEPCYECLSEVFLGPGKSATLYREGDIVIEQGIPNNQLRPLNRKAGLNHARWIESLPVQGAQVGIDDLAEAAMLKRNDPRMQQLDPLTYQKVIVRLAVELKLKREGRDVLSMSPHNFVRRNAGNAPPMLGAKTADRTQIGPGNAGEPSVRGPTHRLSPDSPTANPLGGPNPL